MKNAKTKTVKGANKTKFTIKKLQANKKYYIRIRAYKIVNGKKVYSKWTTKKSVKTKKYTIVLKDNTGKAMKKVKVTLKIKGKKTITVKTNSKGKATFKIKKLTKKGTYKSTVTYKGNKYYNKVTKKVKIKVK